jgi:hypothetical protein
MTRLEVDDVYRAARRLLAEIEVRKANPERLEVRL